MTEGTAVKAAARVGPKFHRFQVRIVQVIPEHAVEHRKVFVLHPEG